jgi:hypothetical protein
VDVSWTVSWAVTATQWARVAMIVGYSPHKWRANTISANSTAPVNPRDAPCLDGGRNRNTDETVNPGVMMRASSRDETWRILWNESTHLARQARHPLRIRAESKDRASSGRILITGSIAGFMPGTYQAV